MYSICPKQRRLLIAGDTRNRNARALDFCIPIDTAAVADGGQHCAGDVERVQQAIVPIERVDIIDHCARGVCIIGYMRRAAGQFPDQPAIHRTEQDFAPARANARARRLIQNPFDLGPGKVSVRDQARRLPDVTGQALFL